MRNLGISPGEGWGVKGPWVGGHRLGVLGTGVMRWSETWVEAQWVGPGGRWEPLQSPEQRSEMIRLPFQDSRAVAGRMDGSGEGRSGRTGVLNQCSSKEVGRSGQIRE